MTTTPYDARRAVRLREAHEKVYHLAHVVKDYTNVRNDGFGVSHLARIEKILEETTVVVRNMVAEERRQLLAVDPLAPRTSHEEVIATIDVGRLDTVARVMEQTVPTSLLDRIRAQTDCD